MVLIGRKKSVRRPCGFRITRWPWGDYTGEDIFIGTFRIHLVQYHFGTIKQAVVHTYFFVKVEVEREGIHLFHPVKFNGLVQIAIVAALFKLLKRKVELHFIV